MTSVPRKPTIRDVAILAGVSLGTASRVINGLPNVTAPLRERVQAAIAQLRFEPNALAQGMRSGATRTIGLVLHDITLRGMARFVRAVQNELQAAGYTLLFACHEGKPALELQLLQRLMQRGVDGLIVSTSSEADPRLTALLSSLPVPVVLHDREAGWPADAVRVDHHDGARQAVDHLLSLGHRRIAMLTGPADVYAARARVEGYEAAFRARGVPIPPRLLERRIFEPEMGRLGTTVLLDRWPLPTALILGGTGMLAGALGVIRARGLRIPQDISLIAAPDSPLTQLHTPPITVMDWCQSDLGSSAARLLVERLQSKNPSEPRHVSIPSRLIIRESSTSPSIG